MKKPHKPNIPWPRKIPESVESISKSENPERLEMLRKAVAKIQKKGWEK